MGIKIYSKKIHQFSKANGSHKPDNSQFLNWFSQPGYQNYKLEKLLKHTLVIGKNGNLIEFSY